MKDPQGNGGQLALALLAFTVTFYGWALLGPLGPELQDDLGLSDVQLPTLSLRSNDARLSILEGLLLAVVKGKTSGLTASTVVSIVKLAAELARNDQEDQLHELERRLEQLAGR